MREHNKGERAEGGPGKRSAAADELSSANRKRAFEFTLNPERPSYTSFEPLGRASFHTRKVNSKRRANRFLILPPDDAIGNKLLKMPDQYPLCDPERKRFTTDREVCAPIGYATELNSDRSRVIELVR